MSKEQLVFDTSDAVSQEHSDKVGAVAIGVDSVGDHQLIEAIATAGVQRLAVDTILRDGSGSPLTSTGGALDVNIASGISLEVDLDHTEDSVRLGDGTSFFSSTAGAGAFVGKLGLDVHIINENLDIRDLDYLQDSVTVHQGDSPWVIGDGGGSITVDATDLDIRVLSHDVEGDSVKIGDGAEIMAVNADGSINVIDDDLSAATDSVASWTHDGTGTAITSTAVGLDTGLDVNILNEIQVEDSALANVAIVAAAKTLTTAGATESAITAALADRKYLHIMNMDNKRVYIGGAGMTASTGYPLSPKAAIMLRAGAAVDVQFVGSAGAQPEIRTLELS